MSGGQAWPADAVVRRPLASLVPYAKNARTHSETQVAQLARLIAAYGWTNPVLVDEAGSLIAGHGRVLAAQSLGLVDVPVMVARGWTADQVKAYRLADNASAAQAGWDDEALKFELGELDATDFDLDLTGFRPDQLAGLLDVTEGLTDPDDVPDVPEVPVTQPGDVWIMGRHRLCCGDATKDSHVSLALAGVRPHLMVTDPPYGVGLDPSWRDRSGANKMAKAGRGGEHYMVAGKTDTEAGWDAVWALSPADVFYVWCAPGPKMFVTGQGLIDTGHEIRQILVWDKEVLTLTRTHYWYTHEHCLYGVRQGKTAQWVGANGQTSVWKIRSPKNPVSGSKEENQPHPAQKPVECMKRPIENNSSPGQAVYEPFCGSGTTLIAAEMTGRSCHALEISAQYCDVAVLRWQAFTGQTAVLERTGQTFEQTANFPSIKAHEPKTAHTD